MRCAVMHCGEYHVGTRVRRPFRAAASRGSAGEVTLACFGFAGAATGISSIAQ